ncbi:universal stress protein [Paenibacillus aestuarii]|uniref:Universal stress protein n=1 Tax=Paenibacillus aestuarii TaxID=516965 RepID=A0ABW0K6L8_9BACL|nr:universal stress protein [Paenibacillus aestuarii]
MLYSKIVVAYDGSETADKALDTAMKLTKLDQDSRLEILHVFNFPKYMLGDGVVVPSISIENTDYSKQVTDKLKGKIMDDSNVHIEVREGASAAKEILAYASESHADLIVVGSRGLNSLGEFILGSVSHSIVQHAKIPVLVVK